MSAREILAVPVALAAIFFLLLAVASPFLLVEQAEENRAALNELRAIDTYIVHRLKKERRLPSDGELNNWAEARKMRLAGSVSTAPLDCLNGFRKLEQDRYVLGYWAGEWSECLSSPSGATTLEPSVQGLLRSGLGVHIASYAVLGLLLGWLAWMLGFRSRRMNDFAA